MAKPFPALTDATTFDAEFWVALLVRAVLTSVAKIALALTGLFVALAVLRAILRTQVVLARWSVVDTLAFTCTVASSAFTMPTTSGRQLFDWVWLIIDRCICISRYDLGLKGKRDLASSGTFDEIAVRTPKSYIARAGAVVAHTVAMTIVVARLQFACSRVPTLIALAHEILQTTTDPVIITILGAYHLSAVIALPL